MVKPEDILVCPSKLGDKTRDECSVYQCCSLKNYPPGAYFVRNQEGDRPLYEDYLKDPKTSSSLGRAGRFYELTPKAVIFVETLKQFAKDHDVPEDKIPMLLEALALGSVATDGFVPPRNRYALTALRKAVDSLVEIGFMKPQERHKK